MEPLAKRLREKLDSMSQEELDKKWEELKHWNEVGPDAREYINQQYQYQLVLVALEKIEAANRCLQDELNSLMSLNPRPEISLEQTADLFKMIVKWAWVEKYPRHFIGPFLSDNGSKWPAHIWHDIIQSGSAEDYCSRVELLGEQMPCLTETEQQARRWAFLDREWAAANMHEYDPLARALETIKPFS